jgi:hypothetical protein
MEKAKKGNKSLNQKCYLMDTLKNYQPVAAISIYKNKSKWSENQIERKPLYYLNYIPILKKAYNLAQDLRNIFENN